MQNSAVRGAGAAGAANGPGRAPRRNSPERGRPSHQNGDNPPRAGGIRGTKGEKWHCSPDRQARRFRARARRGAGGVSRARRTRAQRSICRGFLSFYTNGTPFFVELGRRE